MTRGLDDHAQSLSDIEHGDRELTMHQARFHRCQWQQYARDKQSTRGATSAAASSTRTPAPTRAAPMHCAQMRQPIQSNCASARRYATTKPTIPSTTAQPRRRRWRRSRREHRQRGRVERRRRLRSERRQDSRVDQPMRRCRSSRSAPAPSRPPVRSAPSPACASPSSVRRAAQTARATPRPRRTTAKTPPAAARADRTSTRSRRPAGTSVAAIRAGPAAAPAEPIPSPPTRATPPLPSPQDTHRASPARRRARAEPAGAAACEQPGTQPRDDVAERDAQRGHDRQMQTGNHHQVHRSGGAEQ